MASSGVEIRQAGARHVLRTVARARLMRASNGHGSLRPHYGLLSEKAGQGPRKPVALSDAASGRLPGTIRGRAGLAYASDQPERRDVDDGSFGRPAAGGGARRRSARPRGGGCILRTKDGVLVSGVLRFWGKDMKGHT